jgi:hypothetical protein
MLRRSRRVDSVGPDFPVPQSAGDIVPSAKNNDSLVLRLRFGNTTQLLPGDAERAILSENSVEQPPADVLKVGHHGSKNSTMPDFGGAAAACGRELMERQESAGVRILRTDRDGAIQVLTDGDRVEISCFVACPEEPSLELGRIGRAPSCGRRRLKGVTSGLKPDLLKSGESPCFS